MSNKRKDTPAARVDEIHKQFVADMDELLTEHLRKDILIILEESEDQSVSFTASFKIDLSESKSSTTTRIRIPQIMTDERTNVIGDDLTDRPEEPPLLPPADLEATKDRSRTKKSKLKGGRKKKNTEAEPAAAETNGAA